MTVTDIAVLAYTAGVIDADGSVCLSLTSKGTYRIVISVVDVSGILTSWLKETWGGSAGLYSSSSAAVGKTWYYMWSISGSERAVNFCRAILPFALLKKEQVHLITSFPLLERGRKSTFSIRLARENIRIQMRLLNSRYTSKELEKGDSKLLRF